MGARPLGTHVTEVASNRLLHDKEFIRTILPYHKNPDDLVNNAPAQWQDDKNFMINAMEVIANERSVYTRQWSDDRKMATLKLSSPRLLDDETYLLEVYDKSPTLFAYRTYLVSSERLHKNKKFVMDLIADYEKSIALYSILHPSLKDDRDIFHRAIGVYTGYVRMRYPKSNGDYLYPLSPLQHASDRLKDDDELVRLSVTAFSENLSIASDRIKTSQEHILFALESWRDNPDNDEPPRFFDNDVSSDHKSSYRFMRQAVALCPRILEFSDRKLFSDEDFCSLVSIALGGNSKNGTNHQFWINFYGSRHFRRHLISFWQHWSFCRQVCCDVRKLSNKITSLGGYSLFPIFQGSKREKRDGFVSSMGVASFCADSWAQRQWEKVWLLQQIGQIQCAGRKQKDKLSLEPDIIRCIAEFAGYDQILKLTKQLRAFQPLLNTLLEQKLEDPRWDLNLNYTIGQTD